MFHLVSLGFIEFYWILSSFIHDYHDLLGFIWFFTGINHVLPSFTGFYWVLSSYIYCYYELLGCSMCLPSFTGFYWVVACVYLVLLGFTGF